MSHSITLKNGDISQYGLACGYVQAVAVGAELHAPTDIDPGLNNRRYEVRLTQTAPGCDYRVMVIDQTMPWDERHVFDANYPSLGLARRAYRSCVMECEN